jgi:1-acyl-sn-glycerol-3-phosphate acyltransferase
MQEVIIEKPYTFMPPYRTTLFSTIYRFLKLHAWYLKWSEKVTSYELRGLEIVKASLDAGHGVLLAPNHSRTADPLVMAWIPTEANCHMYGLASWHLYQSRFQSFFLRSMGAFSVNREGVDRAAVNMAIEILTNAERPLVMFPEGTTTRTNDRLGPLLDGVAFIARTAAKRRAKHSPPGKVVIHPIATKYLFQGDVEEAVDETLVRIEHRLSWPPQRHLSLLSRIVKVGSALLSLKEIEFFGEPHSGPLAERMNRLIDHLVGGLEKELFGKVTVGHAVPRVKALRMRLLPDMVAGRVDEQERARRWRALSEIYLAQQISAYPPDYLSSRPSTDRMLEIVEKYEEDLTDVCRPHGPTKVVIEVGAAIEVSPERDRGAAVDPLMASLEQRLQEMLDRLSLESPLYVPKRFPNHVPLT